MIARPIERKASRSLIGAAIELENEATGISLAAMTGDAAAAKAA